MCRHYINNNKSTGGMETRQKYIHRLINYKRRREKKNKSPIHVNKNLAVLVPIPFLILFPFSNRQNNIFS